MLTCVLDSPGTGCAEIVTAKYIHQELETIQVRSQWSFTLTTWIASRWVAGCERRRFLLDIRCFTRLQCRCLAGLQGCAFLADGIWWSAEYCAWTVLTNNAHSSWVTGSRSRVVSWTHFTCTLSSLPGEDFSPSSSFSPRTNASWLQVWKYQRQ